MLKRGTTPPEGVGMSECYSSILGAGLTGVWVGVAPMAEVVHTCRVAIRLHVTAHPSAIRSNRRCDIVIVRIASRAAVGAGRTIWRTAQSVIRTAESPGTSGFSWSGYRDEKNEAHGCKFHITLLLRHKV